jgi:iron complex outermembrane receptor protein
MEKQQKFALTPVAGAIAAALAPSHQALAQESTSGLDEIIVTATKRTVSVQEIPASIQAITQNSLAAMGAKNMEDYSRFVPAVNVVSYGAGSNTIVFRGAITGNSYIAQSTSSVYLDEVSLTTTGSQPSIRMVDIERVEALSGPQGTLYGSDAQAGTMRIITNKPKLDTFEAIIDAEVRAGDKSDESYRGSLVFNIPLIEEKLAMRIVGYSDHDGGFIDNVFGHTPDTLALRVTFDEDGIPSHPGYPSGWGSLDNSASVEENWNDADVTGGRLSLLWAVNDRWSANFVAVAQQTEAGADSFYDPFVGDLQTVTFHKDYRTDDYEMYSLVLEGDLGFAQLVASANYYDREIEMMRDITVYGHYWAAAYCHDSYYTTSSLDVYDHDEDGDVTEYAYPYYWENPNTGYIVFYPVYCMGETIEGDFFQNFTEPASQDKTTIELRLSNQGDTFDWIVGYYKEESNDDWADDFAGGTLGGDGLTNTYQNSMSLNYMEFYFTNWVYYDPALAPNNLYYTYPEATAWWLSDSHTDWDQDAVFGEVTWHINDSWDLTVGGRYFERSNTNFYRVDHPGDLGFNGEPDPADPESRAYRFANNNMAPAHSDSETEFIPKVALSWTMSDNSMLYGLYTQGTRPGGVNRSRGEPFFATSYSSDLMDNYEGGYRSTFSAGRGRFNATAYHMVWTDYQLSLTDPSSRPCDEVLPDPDPPEDVPNLCGQPWQSIVTNAGEAHITGLNVELDYAFNDSWVFGGNAMMLEAETDTTADLTGDGTNDLVSGLRLPLTPEFKASAWLDATNPSELFGGEEVFARLQISYTGDSVNKLDPIDPAGLDDANPQLISKAYTIADFRTGIRGPDWELSFFVNNLTDERASYSIGTGRMLWGASSVQDGRAHWQNNYVNRPREFGARFMKRWGD